MRVLVALGGNAMTGRRRQRHARGPARRHRAAPWSTSPASSRPATRSSSRTATARRSATCSSRTSSPPQSCRRCRWTGAAPRPRPRSASPSSTRSSGRSPRAASTRPVRRASITRTLVDADDPGFTQPTKPIGRFLPYEQAQAAHRARPALGGPRREGLAPRRRLARAARGPRDPHAADAPRRRLRRRRGRRRRHPRRRATEQGGVRGVEAVIDKDLTAAVLARSVEADVLVIATDVDHAVIGYGTPRRPRRRHGHARARWRSIAAAGPLRLRLHGAQGRGGAALRAQSGGQRSIITALDRITEAHRRKSRDHHRE